MEFFSNNNANHPDNLNGNGIGPGSIPTSVEFSENLFYISTSG